MPDLVGRAARVGLRNGARLNRYKLCDCEGGAILVPDTDAPGETMWTRCPRCRGAGEIYFGADNEPEDYPERDDQ